jgi:hypothetical protein
MESLKHHGHYQDITKGGIRKSAYILKFKLFGAILLISLEYSG